MQHMRQQQKSAAAVGKGGSTVIQHSPSQARIGSPPWCANNSAAQAAATATPYRREPPHACVVGSGPIQAQASVHLG
jgi:hypothetical protein